MCDVVKNMRCKVIWKTRELQTRKLQYVVTGTGRSGTVYMAKALTSVGIPCGHEAIFTPAGMDYALRKLGGEPIADSLVSIADGRWLSDQDKIIAESSYMAAPYCQQPVLENAKIIHVVRHPLRVAFSFVDGFGYFQHNNPGYDPYQQFIYKHIPELYHDMMPIERACLYYVIWNDMIEKKHLFYHVEENGDNLMSFLEVSKKPQANRRSNSRCRKFTHTIDEIPNGSIKGCFLEIIERYGYFPEAPWYNFAAVEEQ
jgi:hypothetical protein